MVKRNHLKLGQFSYETEKKKKKKKIAEKLVKELNLNVEYARFHVDGTYYAMIDVFPAALFDLFGYVIIYSEDDHKNIIFTKKINIHNGINKLPSYVKYTSAPKAFVDYEQRIKDIKVKTEKQKKEESVKFSGLQSIMQNAMKKSGATSNLLPA